MTATVSLSVVVLTKNEAGRIEECIRSVAWADEILVVDDESTDETIRIAESLGARVLKRRMDIEGRHRNWAYAQAKHEWVLSLDADERVTPELAQEIQSMLRNGAPFETYAIPRRTYIGTRWIRHGGWYPSAQLKLFKKSVFRWEETTVHPRAISDRPSGTLRHDLIHYSYRDLTDFVQKMNYQTSLEAQKWVQDGRRMTLGKALWRTLDRFLRAFLGKGGYRDGVWGFVVAATGGMYQLLSFAKYWEQRRGLSVEAVVAPFRSLIRDDEHFDRVLLMSHLCAYKLASQFARGRQVLEIGSGTGYGAWYLAQTAREVVAVDADQRLIERARSLFCRPNLTYAVMDGTRLDFPDGAFDVVGTFQVIEHIELRRLQTFLKEIARVLKPDGVVVISTLNLDHNRKPGTVYTKPTFHEKEFTAQELEGLLRSVFPAVEIHGLYPRTRYRLLLRLKKWGLERWAADVNPIRQFFRETLTTRDHVLRQRCTPAAIDLIAYCAKGPRMFIAELEA